MNALEIARENHISEGASTVQKHDGLRRCITTVSFDITKQVLEKEQEQIKNKVNMRKELHFKLWK
jgi:hypothetical protein